MGGHGAKVLVVEEGGLGLRAGGDEGLEAEVGVEAGPLGGVLLLEPVDPAVEARVGQVVVDSGLQILYVELQIRQREVS